MKIYCRNCKYEGLLICKIMSKNSIDNEYTNRCEGFKKVTDNKNGDCKNYERKWYKFWVK